MKRQAVLTAMLSASVFFAIGTAITSQAAAKGWVETDGVWQYLDNSGEPVTETWKKSETQYFWLDEHGEMALDKLIEDDGTFYYVDTNGARVLNEWRRVVNEDGWENGDNDERPEFIWYYFGSAGKAVTGKKTINEKTYIFDEDGEMFSSWTTYRDKTYYLGSEEEGWAYTGWQYLELTSDMKDEYDDDDVWFHFKSTGEMRKSDDEDSTRRVYINGSYFGFDSNGVMVDGWVPQYLATSTNSAYYMDDTGEQQSGWVYTDANNEDSDDGGDDDDGGGGGGSKWYYLNSKGKPFNVGGYYTDDFSKPSTGTVRVHKGGSAGRTTSQIAAKVIGSKTYLFDNTGAVMTGVYEVTNTVNKVGGSGNLEAGIYYFGKTRGSTYGRMETGKITVRNNGQPYSYYFASNGKAYTNMIVGNCLYKSNGVLLDADEDKTIYEIDSEDFSSTITCRNSSIILEPGDRIILNADGKLKKNGTVTIDGTKFTVSNYVITSES